jgi:hypothetical protein
MKIGRSKKSRIVNLIDKDLEKVENFKYLGVIIKENGKIEEEINTRMLNAGKVYHAINKKFPRKERDKSKTKMAIYSSTYIPTLLYESESWVITDKQKQDIQTAEMKYLRRVIGKTRRDKIRNEMIRMNLGIQPLHNKMEQAQLRWFGHLNRMDEEKLTKQVWEARTEELGMKRPRGRPRRTWNDNIQEHHVERIQEVV